MEGGREGGREILEALESIPHMVRHKEKLKLKYTIETAPNRCNYNAILGHFLFWISVDLSSSSSTKLFSGYTLSVGAA